MHLDQHHYLALNISAKKIDSATGYNYFQTTLSAYFAMKALLRSSLTGLFLLSLALNTAAASRTKSAAEKLPTLPLTEKIVFMVTAAEIALQRGIVPEALDTYIDLAKMTKDPRFAQRALEISINSQQTDKALISARLWRKFAPDSADAKQALSFLLTLQGNWKELKPLIHAQLMNLSDKKRALALVNLQQQFSGSVDKTGAAAAFAELVKTDKPRVETQLALARSYLQADQPQLAEEALDHALKLHPGYPPAVLMLAGFHLQSGKIELAQRSLLNLINNTSKSSTTDKRAYQLAYRLLAQISEQKQDLVGAQAWLDKIDAPELLLETQIQRAQLLIKQNKVDAAQALFAELHKQTQLSEQQHYELTQIEIGSLLDAKAYTNALALLEKQTKERPKDANLWYGLAMTQEKLELYLPMEQSLRQVLKLDPAMAQAQNALGYSMANRNVNLPEARALIAQALATNPDDPYMLDSMGWVEYRLGNLTQAKTLLQQAFSNKPDTEIAAHLGEVLWRIGEINNARDILRQALILDAENTTLKSTLQRLLKPGESLN